MIMMVILKMTMMRYSYCYLTLVEMMAVIFLCSPTLTLMYSKKTQLKQIFCLKADANLSKSYILYKNDFVIACCFACYNF